MRHLTLILLILSALLTGSCGNGADGTAEQQEDLTQWAGLAETGTLTGAEGLLLFERFCRWAEETGDSLRQQKAINRIVGMAASSQEDITLSALMGLAQYSLYEIESKNRNEELYLMFLDAFLRQKGIPDGQKGKAEFQRKGIVSNRPGTKAAGFRAVKRDGQATSLDSISSRHCTTLVVFYDPECDHCREMISELSLSEKLKNLVSDGKISVVAAYTEGDREVWAESRRVIPEEWADIMVDDTDFFKYYNLRMMPAFYLIGKDGNVTGKDVEPDDVFRIIEKLNN